MVLLDLQNLEDDDEQSREAEADAAFSLSLFNCQSQASTVLCL
ncbi:SapB/AmfS family lantipeptide [Streptomyces sp. PRKS01-65]|nr:SapB/AmfS family lanthipeptide [Streptomyces harenosi]NEY30967.1 SapB/AmfS family lantipeptide [Streptomyces harenosi]